MVFVASDTMITLMAYWEDADTYGEAVKAVLDTHCCTFRSQRQRTGIAHSTVAGWVNDGIPPSFKSARAFAKGFGIDEFRWLTKAGFPSGDSVMMTPDTWFKARAFDLYTLGEALGIRFRAGWFHGGSENAIETQEQAEASIRRRVQLLIDDHPEHTARLQAFLEEED